MLLGILQVQCDAIISDSFWGDVVMDSVNMSSRDEHSFLDQILYVRIVIIRFFLMIYAKAYRYKSGSQTKFNKFLVVELLIL